MTHSDCREMLHVGCLRPILGGLPKELSPQRYWSELATDLGVQGGKDSFTDYYFQRGSAHCQLELPCTLLASQRSKSAIRYLIARPPGILTKSGPLETLLFSVVMRQRRRNAVLIPT